MSTPPVRAGGKVDADTVYHILVPGAGVDCDARILKASPSLLSLSRRVMDDGLWMAENFRR